MSVFENYDLTTLNTFGVPAKAKFFTELANEADIEELFNTDVFKQNPKLFLGGGSNVLFTKDFKGIVIANKLKGVEITKESDTEVYVRSMSGEVWHDLVTFCVDRGYWGIENLALIPGTVGGGPVQNIGAYGVELISTLDSVEVCEIETGKKIVLSKDECKLGYRDSVFKGEAKGKYFISAVVLKLSKIPKINTSYAVLSSYLIEHGVVVKTAKDISDAVVAIRKSKLPDPKVTGNAGSFFKNVFVDKEKLESLTKEYPGIPHFEESGVMKIPAGWLIEQCGWKGKTVGNVGVHEKQALVLVNKGGATGEEIRVFSESIIKSVYDKFGLKITPEVNLI